MQSSLLKCMLASMAVVQVAVGLFTKSRSMQTRSQGSLAAGLASVSETQGAVIPSSPVVMMPLRRTVMENNLGGLGPNKTQKKMIRYSPMVKVDKGGGKIDLVDMVVENLTTYEVNIAKRNGLRDQFGQINVKAKSTVSLRFRFVEHGTDDSYVMPPYDITFYDLDGPKKKPDIEKLTISADFVNSYTLVENSEVDASFVEDAGPGSYVFQSTQHGKGCDNPGSLETLGHVTCPNTTHTVDQRKRSVVLHMKGNSSEFRFSYSVLKGKSGRNFLFALPAAFGEYILEPTPSPTPVPTPGPTPPQGGSIVTPAPTTPAPTPGPTPPQGGSIVTPAPTTGGSVSEFGDPHVSNINQEAFDILSVGIFKFLAIPGSPEEAEESALTVHAKVEALGPLCAGRLYVTKLWFAGGWLGELRSLELATKISQDDMEAGMENVMRIKTGNADAVLDAPGLLAAAPPFPVEVAEFHPDKPKDVNEHVTMVLIKLSLGPAIFKVRHVLQREKSGYSNALWLSASGLQAVDSEIHGLLGKDDHTLAASPPQECGNARRSPRTWYGVHTSASLADDQE